MPSNLSPNDPCPCWSGLKYKKCCRALHHGMPAPSPETLMRSRYSAYALGLIDYIIQTTAPDGPQFVADREAWRRDLIRFSTSTQFAGLSILEVGADTVTFRAILFEGSREVSFTERSLFRQYDGRWLYYSALPENTDG